MPEKNLEQKSEEGARKGALIPKGIVIQCKFDESKRKQYNEFVAKYTRELNKALEENDRRKRAAEAKHRGLVFYSSNPVSAY